MAETDDQSVHLARELIYYAGHGYTGDNAARYPTLLGLPQVFPQLPAGATASEVANHIDNVLIAAIRSFRTGITLRFSGVDVPVEELRDHWTKLLGLPPYVRAFQLDRHRRDLTDVLHGGSVSTWRRAGGPEEELMSYLADLLLRPPGPLGGGNWVIRKSTLQYFIGHDRSIVRIDCRYDGETLREGVTTFGVDHRNTSKGQAAEYEFIEGSVIGCDQLAQRRLDDGTLSLDLGFDPSLKRADRRLLGYDLGVTNQPGEFEVIRLNAVVMVWAHDLSVTFSEGVLPDRIWWFAHHVGTGAGQEPQDDSCDLVPSTDLTVHQSFAGLRQGPDYGIAFRWDERGGIAEEVISLG